MKEQKNSFSGRIGFILAAAGSAVGLGNIWRFPYLAAKYGGGTFLLIYLILAVTFGFALMLTEIALGRKTGKSTLYAFTSLNKKFSFLGVLSSIVPIIIFPYYCVIGGWVAKYLFVYVTGQGLAATEDSFFTGFIGEVGQPLFWLFLFIAATAFIVMLGVEKGIEKASKILMPILVLLSLGIAVYVVTRPGAVDGLIYYIKPDFSEFSVNCVLAAMGQLFYSMSLAMGIMITYGSYMPKSENIESSVRSIELFDTGIAFYFRYDYYSFGVRFFRREQGYSFFGAEPDVYYASQGFRQHAGRCDSGAGIFPACFICGPDFFHFFNGNGGVYCSGQIPYEKEDGVS